MSTRHSQKFISALKKSRRFRDALRKNSRKLHLEQLEDRRVMAVGPNLTALATNEGDNFLAANTGIPLPNVVVQHRPTELDFLFAQGQKIDPATLASGFKVVRAGADGALGSADDVVIAPGYIGLLDDPRAVVMRFASNLPDDLYQITVVGSGATPLKDLAGLVFNGGVNELISFRLNAGAQVQAIVP